MSSTPNPKHELTSSPSASSTPPSGTSGHKNSLKGTKLARRARSFKDDIFEKFSQMRTPTNTLGRSHSPHRHSPHNKHAVSHSPDRKPTQGLDYHVRQIRNALKHFKDVISKKKLEVLPGNATILLELTANMRSALQLYALNPNSSTLSSACTQVYFALGELIKLCDDVLLSENEQESPLLSSENVQRVVNLLETSVQNWCDIVNEKMQEKENALSVTGASNSSSNTLHRPTIDVAGQRTSLPDIPLTPIERDILEKSSLSTMKTSHSTESILRDSSPPPKPPLPNRCPHPPPLPPKRRSQPKQNSITNESNYSVDSSLLSCGLDHLSMRSKSPDDNSSLLSASAGSLDSAFNHSREEDELKALAMDASMEDPLADEDMDHMLNTKSAASKKEENAKNALPGSVTVGKNQRNSNESGFASMQSIRASTQSISTKRSSEHSTQSHKSSIASSTEITSLKHTDSKLGSDIDDLMDQSFMNNQSKTTSCFSNQAFSSERCITTSCNFLRSANEMCSSNKVLNESESVSLHSEKSMTKTMFSTNKLENQDGFLNTFASSPQSIREEPPALPVKTRGKGMSKERLVSHYDNVEEHDHSPSHLSKDEVSELRQFTSAFPLQSKHQSLIGYQKYSGSEDPPPIPKKTKHIMVYMEILPTQNPMEHFRHSVHTCHSSQTSSHFSTTRNISHSQTMNMACVSKQLVSQSSTSSMPETEKPPALPPKKQYQRPVCKTPTIITTPPPSPKPGTLGGGYENRPRLIGSANLSSDMLTVNEEGNDLAEEEELSHNIYPDCNNDGEDEVVLRNNTINKQECTTPNKVDSIPDLIEEIDISNYLIFKKDGEDGPEVKGGYIDALIVHATKVQRNENDETEDAFSEAFITTFRTFISPMDLITKLIQRYSVFVCQVNDQYKQKAAKETFSLMVRVVNDLTASDLHLKLLSKLTDFVYQMVRSGELPSAKALRSKIVEKANLYKAWKSNANDTLEKQRDIAKTLPSLLDLKSVEIAEQMTLLDAELFQKIEIPEVLIFVKEQCEEKSPNLNRFTEHFNKMSYWARSQILSQDDAKDREKYVIKFIKIMKHLRKINNYNSYLALLSALDSAPIRRLEWHKTITEGLKEYCALIDSSSSFRVYRQALAETSPPCIPYIGLVLQDLTFVHVGNPDYLKEGVINFSKRWQQHNIIVNMKKFKKCTYPFRRSEKIIRFFENFENYLEEEQMWQISESIKPRGRKPQHN
ncbi:unnamed protein product [Hermetia illucens]|uniref:CRK SH3-binding GNRP n=1 Tax=Hermetia illucens TaxID=343691 RepID=A0A7R8V1Q4_HERIL|nr:unnamed protein product [Hermetia illucens]